MGDDGAGMSDVLLQEERPYSENDDMKTATAGGNLVSTGHQRRCQKDGRLGTKVGLLGGRFCLIIERFRTIARLEVLENDNCFHDCVSS